MLAGNFSQAINGDETGLLTSRAFSVPHEVYEIIHKLQPKAEKKAAQREPELSRHSSTLSMQSLDVGAVAVNIKSESIPTPQHQTKLIIYIKLGVAYGLLVGRTLSCLYRFVTAQDAVELFSELPWIDQWKSSPNIRIIADSFAGTVTFCDMIRTIGSSKGHVIELCTHESWKAGIAKFCFDVRMGEIYPKRLLIAGFFAMLGTMVKGYKGAATIGQTVSIENILDGWLLSVASAAVGLSSSICFITFNILQISMWVLNTRKKFDGTRYRIVEKTNNTELDYFHYYREQHDQIRAELCGKGDDIYFEKSREGNWSMHFGNKYGEHEAKSITNVLEIAVLNEQQEKIENKFSKIIRRYLDPITLFKNLALNERITKVSDEKQRAALESITDAVCGGIAQYQKNKEIRKIYQEFIIDNKNKIFMINFMGLLLSVGGSLTSGISLFYENNEFQITIGKIVFFIPVVAASAYMNYNFILNPNYQLDLWMGKHHKEHDSCINCQNTPGPEEEKTAWWIPGERVKNTVGFFSSLGGAMTFTPGIIRTMQIALNFMGWALSKETQYDAMAQNDYFKLGGFIFSIAFIILSFLQDYAMWTAGASRKKPTLPQSPVTANEATVSFPPYYRI